VIDHGDGTQTTMLHLAQGSLDPALACGAFVRRGQRVATTGAPGGRRAFTCTSSAIR